MYGRAGRLTYIQKRRFPARAEGYVFVGDLADAEDEDLAALGLKKPEVKRLRRWGHIRLSPQ